VPTYEYHCEHCEQTFDVFQSFQDDSLTACPTCGNPVRKVYGNVGVVFKGSGFYKNDSRPKEASKSSSENGASSKESADTGSTATATKAPATDGAKKDAGSSDKSPTPASTPKAPV
jgi:putative FmdB family regulatory protein